LAYIDPPDDPLEDDPPPDDDPLEDDPLGDELKGALPEPVDGPPGDNGRTPEGVLVPGSPRSDSTPVVVGSFDRRGRVPD